MKIVGVIAAGLLLGLSSPAVAHAHAQFLDNVIRKAIGAGQPSVEQPFRPERSIRPELPREMVLLQPPGKQKNKVEDDDDNRPKAPPPRLVPLNQVVAQIRRTTPGDLLDASGPSGGDRPVYRIRWQAASGQRIDFVVDAQTGAIIGRSGG